MATVPLVMLLVAAVFADLPPEPSVHLTPPEVERPPAATLRRFPRNDSSQALQENRPSEDGKAEPQQQEARAILWAAPAIPIISSHRGRSSENCNPCEQAPWMPMARALNTQQYALSIPTIQLAVPVNYGIPLSHIKPPSQYDAVPPPDYGPPKQPGPPPLNYGPPPPERLPPPPQPSPQYGPPPPERAPPQPQPSPQYGPSPPERAPPQPQPSPQYGQPPTEGDSRGSNPQEEENGGLPPPPLPQRFVEPFKVYGPPRPFTQVTSASNVKPSAPKYAPLPAPPLPNYPPPPQKYGQPSDLKLGPKLPSNYPPLQPLSQQSHRPLTPGPQQYQQGSAKYPVLIHAPIPFPSMSKTLLPPMFNYKPFNDGKSGQLHSYLRPPKPQNVVFTLSDTEDVCKKCEEKNKAKDSETAQAEHVTENVLTTTASQDYNQKHNVQVVKSVPLAEYLASVEYPMQIIQAPILDVPDLAKYFDLGYHQFPQVAHQKDNYHKVHDQKPASSFLQQHQQNPVYINHNFNTFSSATQSPPALTSGLDNVDFNEDQRHTTNNIPHNHKPDLDSLGKNRQTTEKGFTSSPFQHTTAFLTSSTRPNQILHISKIKPNSHLQSSPKPSTNGHSHIPLHPYHSQAVSHTTFSTPPTIKYSTTSGHFVTSKPASDEISSTQTSSTTEPDRLNDAEQSPSQNHPATATGGGSAPSGPSSLRFLDPPPVDSTGPSDWMRYSFGRGWGHTPPQPFVMPTSSPQRARFVNRPTPAPGKKAKHIHQIIVPYTTNKQRPPAVQEPANNLGWTPIPPTNQGRKVPTGLDFGDHYPSTTGLDQTENQHQNIFPTGHSQFVENLPPSAPVLPLNSFGPHQIPPVVSDPQPMNLPPHVINQILQLNQQGVAWPSGPDGLQQFLMSNLQGLLRGEEDSVDFARLQKNIDNWTAEGYKQNSPSVNFIPVTAIPPRIYNSKKIPEEYLTATEPTVSSSSTQHEPSEIYNHNNDIEGAESQKHNVKVYPEVHSKEVDKSEEAKEEKDVIESLLNSWSLLDTKVVSSEQTSTEPSIDPESSSEPTSKAWEKIQVSISPLTNEKVYVVTPVPVTESSESTRVERSHSLETPVRSAKVLKPSNPNKTEHAA